jgi:Protein of unknown function (DUF3224)
MRANAIVQVTHWERTVVHEQEDAPPLVRVRFLHSFSGDIVGEGVLEYLMLERPEATTRFVGLERVTGHIGGREGSFVLEHTGKFEAGRAQVGWQVVPASGTGELANLRGSGGFTAGHASRYPVTLDYELV